MSEPRRAPDRAAETAIRRAVHDIAVCMFTTVDADGRPDARPMLALMLDEDPRLYFLTRRSSCKASRIETEPVVGVTFASNGRYLALRGLAELDATRPLIARLWHPSYRAWFPLGVDDPDLVALRIEVVRADAWDAPVSRVTRALAALVASITRTPHETPRRTLAR